MTSDQLKTAYELNEKISNLKNEQTKWTVATGVQHIRLTPEPRGYDNYPNIDFINFNVLKALTLDNINKQIATAESELAAM